MFDKVILELQSQSTMNVTCSAGQWGLLQYECPVKSCDECRFADGYVGFKFDFTGRGEYNDFKSSCVECTFIDCAACFECPTGTFSAAGRTVLIGCCDLIILL